MSLIIPTTSPVRVAHVLESLAAQDSTGVSFETIVVVNGAGDEVAQAVEAVADDVQIVSSAVNRAVPGGYNLGRSVASGELIVMMHDDVELEPGWLRAWLDASDQHPEAGVIGSKVLYPDGSLRGAGSVLWSDATTSQPWAGETPSADSFATPRAVDYSASCSLLVRSEVWDACGGLNDDLYPAYFVDVDIAMSARNLGWSVLYWPESRVRHEVSDPGRARWRGFVAGRNRDRFIARWSQHLPFQHPNDGDLASAIALAARWAPATAAEIAEGLRPRALAPRPTVIHDDDYYRSRERELHNEYARFLEAALDHAQVQLSALNTD